MCVCVCVSERESTLPCRLIEINISLISDFAIEFLDPVMLGSKIYAKINTRTWMGKIKLKKRKTKWMGLPKRQCNSE